MLVYIHANVYACLHVYIPVCIHTYVDTVCNGLNIKQRDTSKEEILLYFWFIKKKNYFMLWSQVPLPVFCFNSCVIQMNIA